AVTEYAKTKGVKTCVENHGFFAQDAERVEKLINAVDDDNFGALVDIGNFSCADEYNPRSVGIMAPYAFHAHAKDFHIKSGNGENPGDGFFAQDAERVEKLINAVDDDNFGALVDIGNFSCADEYNPRSVGIMAPYAFHAHAKDFHIKSGNGENPGDGFFMSRGGNYLRGSIIGHGDVPVKQCVNALRRAGYDGYLMIEFEGMEDPITGISVGLKNLKRIVG
ncbi:MAG: TIM barrel protein, partial [Clostridia bacterium]|nr:TIM barrel protein [Clostridia bacterium]